MSFSSPIFLAALLLLIPTLITFLVRRNRRILRVPSTMVWRMGARSIAKNRRIRDVRRWIALVACLAAVATLGVAASRPSTSRSEATVFVVDVSASMAGSPISDARTWIKREAASVGPSARIAIVTAGSEARVALAPSAPGPLLDSAVESLAATTGSSSLEDAVALAAGLARGQHARVVVLTDHAIDADVQSAKETKLEVRVFDRGTAKDNLGITSLFTRTPADARDDEEREASVSIATSSTVSRRAHLVITLGTRVVADRRVEVPAQGEVSERATIRGGGRLVAKISSDDRKPDAMSVDNEASLDEIARKPPHVIVVRDEGDSAAAYFVEKAIRAAGVTNVVAVTPSNNFESFKDDKTEAKKEKTPKPQVEAEASIAVVLKDGPQRPRGMPAFFIGAAPDDVRTRVVDKNQTHLRSMTTEDPLLRGVSFDELTTLRAQVALAPPHGSRSLVDLDGGPTLLVGGTEENAWVWLGIDPDSSDLVLRVAFPVLVGNVLGHLAGAAQTVTAKTVPRSEVTLASRPITTPLPPAREPPWRLPITPTILLASVGALLLAIEAWLTFKRRWAT